MTIKKSAGNVFQDIGFEAFEAEQLAVKSDLITLIGIEIEQRKLTQKEAAEICGTHQSSLSKILNGKLDSVTIDQLAKWLVCLGINVQISVSQPRNTRSTKKGSLTLQQAA